MDPTNATIQRVKGLSTRILEAARDAGILDDPYADRLVARLVKMNESDMADEASILDLIPNMPGTGHLIAPDGGPLDQEPAGAWLDDLHNATGADPDRPTYAATRLADVEAERVRWLWPARLPLGKLVVLDGDPSVGKSTLAVDLAARVSTGRPMPGENLAALPASPVILMAGEDGLADTIRPRLDAAEGDPQLVHHLDAVARTDEEGNMTWVPPTIPDDLDQLEAMIIDTGAVLVIVDVLMAYLSGRHDSHRDQDVRRALARLGEIADQTSACVILLRHLRKSRGSALYAGGGSIGIIGVARAGLVVAIDPEDETETRRVLAVSKSNLAAAPPSLGYRLATDPDRDVARVHWLGEVNMTADRLMENPDRDETRTRVEDAYEWLIEMLDADGPMPRAEVMKLADDAGHKRPTVERAQARRGSRVVSERDETRRGRPAIWRVVATSDDFPSTGLEGKPLRGNNSGPDACNSKAFTGAGLISPQDDGLEGKPPDDRLSTDQIATIFDTEADR